ncbi:exonuclease domain-containing protein [Candidatus Vidania fulgoroideorum]
MKTYKNFLILDTETTGLDLQKDRIIEIALVEVSGGRLTGREFHSFINPKTKIKKRSYEIHGISNKFLNSKKSFKEISMKIINFINKSILVAHNALFDASFLIKEFRLAGLNVKLTFIDTLKIFRKIFPGKRNNLDALCDRFNLKRFRKHSAINDARDLAKLFIELLNIKRLKKLQG